MSIFELLGNKQSIKNKSYSRSKMEPLPTWIYKDIVKFQLESTKTIELSSYRDFKQHFSKDVA